MLNQEEALNTLEAINFFIGKRRGSSTTPNDLGLKLEKYDHRLFTRVKRYIGSYRSKLLAMRMADKSAARLIRYWPKAYKLLENLIKREQASNERRSGRALEVAKLMSVNVQFQSSLDKIRRHWGIVPKYPESSENVDMSADDILVQYAFENTPYSKKTWHQLQRTMENKLCTPFKGFIWRLDYGLMVAALCYGLEPYDVLKNWDHIWNVARHQQTFRHVEIRVEDDEKFMGAILTIAYLSNRISQVDPTIPAVINQWIDFARTSRETVQVDDDNIPQALEDISGEPMSPPLDDLTLLVRIYPDTTKEDLTSLWPRISLKQLELWGNQKRIVRNEWDTFESDLVIDKLKQQGQTTQEIIAEHDEYFATMPDKKIGGPSLDSIKDVIKKRLKRLRQRQGKSGGTM